MSYRPPRPLLVLTGLLTALVALTSCSSVERTAAPTPTSAPSASATPEAVSPSPTPSSRPTVDAVRPTASATPAAGSDPASPVPTEATRPPVETAPPPGQPLCKAADLTLTDADAVITAGAVQELFVVRTTGPDCQLQGYPTVILRGAGDAPLTVTYTRGGGGLPPEQPAVETLSRSTSLSFRVSTPRSGSCTPAASISVRLPGTDGDLTTTTGLSVCQSKAGVSPVGRIRADS